MSRIDRTISNDNDTSYADRLAEYMNLDLREIEMDQETINKIEESSIEFSSAMEVLLKGTVIESVKYVIHDPTDRRRLLFIFLYENPFIYTKREIMKRAGFSESYIKCELNEYNDLRSGDTYNKIKNVKTLDDYADYISKYEPYIYRIYQEIPKDPFNVIGRLIVKSVYLGFDFLFLNEILLYPSKRPKYKMKSDLIKTVPRNDMRILKSSNDVLIEKSFLNRVGLLDRDILIPVIRYGSEELGAGMYYSSSDDFCGKFYYFEPGSDVYLHAKKVAFAQNKIVALANLIGVDKTIEFMKRGTDEHGNLKVHEYESKPRSAIFEYKDWGEVVRLMVSGEYDFYTYDEGFCAVEDELDQVLCKVGRNVGIEVFILSMMIGTNRLVTEVLDVRDNSFNHLVRFS